MLVEALEAAKAHTEEHAYDLLVRTIAAIPDLKIFDNLMQADGPTFGRVTFGALARWLLRRAKETSSAEAVASLARYLSQDRLPYRRIMVLGGIKGTTTVKITDNVTLRPFADLQSRYWKDSIAKDYGRFHENYQPHCALEEQVTLPKAHVLPEGPYPQVELKADQTLSDVMWIITALGPAAPVRLGSWTEPDTWVPTGLGGYSGAIPQHFEVGSFPLIPVTKDWAALPESVTRWLLRSERERAVLRVALQRLNRAMRHREPVDAAIDLGIAIESLVLADIGNPAERGELGFRSKLRMARLLGGRGSTRVDLFRWFGDLYDLRSKAVHTGTVPGTTRGMETLALLRMGLQFVAEAARILIFDGYPDWSQLILS